MLNGEIMLAVYLARTPAGDELAPMSPPGDGIERQATVLTDARTAHAPPLAEPVAF